MEDTLDTLAGNVGKGLAVSKVGKAGPQKAVVACCNYLFVSAVKEKLRTVTGGRLSLAIKRDTKAIVVPLSPRQVGAFLGVDLVKVRGDITVQALCVNFEYHPRAAKPHIALVYYVGSAGSNHYRDTGKMVHTQSGMGNPRSLLRRELLFLMKCMDCLNTECRVHGVILYLFH